MAFADRLGHIAVVCIAVMLSATLSVLYVGLERREETCDRQEAIVQAFDLYTDALIEAAEPTDPPTPDEREARDDMIRRFWGKLHDRLSVLTEGCG